MFLCVPFSFCDASPISVSAYGCNATLHLGSCVGCGDGVSNKRKAPTTTGIGIPIGDKQAMANFLEIGSSITYSVHPTEVEVPAVHLTGRPDLVSVPALFMQTGTKLIQGNAVLHTVSIGLPPLSLFPTGSYF